jgi:hypothetical protein
MQSERIIVIFMGAVFGGLAALMAYLIASQEYSHHFPDSKRVRHSALESALIAFAVFFGLSIILAVILPSLL